MKHFYKFVIVCLVIIGQMSEFQAQSYPLLSEFWQKFGGETTVFYENATYIDGSGNVYVAGSTVTLNATHDILVQKFDSSGDLIWEATYDGGIEEDDIAADVYVDNNGNVYVTGATTQSSGANIDLVVLKYSSTGVFQWSYTYDNGGNPEPYDTGVALTGDNNGNIYVTGTSAGSSTLMDIVTLKLNAANGVALWIKRFDSSQLNDVPRKIAVNDTLIYVTGATQVILSTMTWKIVALSFSSADGQILNVLGTNGLTTNGIDEAYDMTIDLAGNVYVVGATKNTNNDYDISVFKFDDELNLIWERHIDGHGNDDKGKGIKVDAQGNVYVVGYVTHPTQGKNMAIVRLSSQGVPLWKRELNGLANADDEAVQVVLAGGFVYLTGTVVDGTHTDVLTIGCTDEGNFFSRTTYSGPDQLHDRPTALGKDLQGNLIVIAQLLSQNGRYKNVAIKYIVVEKPLVPVFDNNIPVFNDNELIIRFDRSVIHTETIDRKNYLAGPLSDFITEDAINLLSDKLSVDANRLTAYKIFKNLTTADSLSVTRLGDTIRIPDFWATLSVFIPDYLDENDALAVLNDLKPVVHYAELNYFNSTLSVPNDPLFSSQPGLTGNNGINVLQAWDFQVGKPYTRLGVVDTGVRWDHQDFHSDNELFLTWESSRFKGGYDYQAMVAAKDQNPAQTSDHHGTAVSGIIGATRFNGTCSAGIAGGKWDSNEDYLEIGCSLYTLMIIADSLGTTVNAIQAFLESSIQPTDHTDYMALHILNNSWGGAFYSQAFFEQIMFANRNHVLVVAASGNTFNANCVNSNQFCPFYPANYDDEYILRVGASNNAGLVPNFSVRGSNLDVVAPGTSASFVTINHHTQTACSFSDDGTSYSAAFASGTTALMHSQHNVLNSEYNYPNDLAPEDFEQILQNTAKDINQQDGTSIGWDFVSGYGIIDAGAALHQVSLPYYYVKHNDNPAQLVYTLLHSSVQLSVPSNIFGTAPGTYVADRYEVTHTYTTTIPSAHTLVGHWQRTSSTDGVHANANSNGKPWLSYSLSESVNGTQRIIDVETTTYCWYITEDQNGTPMDAWYPMEPNALRMAYSLHVKTDLTLHTPSANLEYGVILYPNPTNGNELHYNFDFEQTGQPTFDFVNLAGQLVLRAQPATTDSQSIDISSLGAGFYICRITVGDQVLNTNFIKL